ncbi:hypothetical protein HK102_007835, partial [Quaeritorhiza haematococci]
MPEQTMLAARNKALAVTAAGYADSDVVRVDVMDGRPLGMMNGKKKKGRGEDDPTATLGVLVNVCQLEMGLIAAQSKSVRGSSVAMRKEKQMKRTMEKAGSAANTT